MFMFTELMLRAVIRLVHLNVLMDYAKRYAKDGIYRIWSFGHCYTIVCNADAAEAILSGEATINKSENHEYYRLWLGNGLLVSKDGEWVGNE